MVNYWLCVTNKENWGIVAKQRIWGVPKRNRRLLESVKPGDTFVFYVKPRRLRGIFKVISDPFISKEKIFGTTGFAEEETFPYRVMLEPVLILKKPIDFAELIPVLTFIRNKKRWTGHIRRALQKIPKGDYKKIQSSMERT
jgi:predicted RNA-binding protein